MQSKLQCCGYHLQFNVNHIMKAMEFWKILTHLTLFLFPRTTIIPSSNSCIPWVVLCVSKSWEPVWMICKIKYNFRVLIYVSSYQWRIYSWGGKQTATKSSNHACDENPAIPLSVPGPPKQGCLWSHLRVLERCWHWFNVPAVEMVQLAFDYVECYNVRRICEVNRRPLLLYDVKKQS